MERMIRKLKYGLRVSLDNKWYGWQPLCVETRVGWMLFWLCLYVYWDRVWGDF